MPVSFGSMLLLAVGVALDATAVAAARGLLLPRVRPRHVAGVALCFGGFQALMPLLGWMLGSQLGALVRAWDHWIAFALLAAIGGKMIWEARGEQDEARGYAREQNLETRDPLGAHVLFALGIATSVDALAVGITLPILNAPLVPAIATMGVTTALLSALGLFVGRRFGAAIGRRLDLVGGVLLIGLGARILIQHLTEG
jgi:putative Mn2+ efflux pump MntP